MGIRFQCHHCGHPLHVKDFQAGRKGRCPQCKGQFRIPNSDAQFSLDPQSGQSSGDAAVATASLAGGPLATATTAQRTIPRTSNSPKTTSANSPSLTSPDTSASLSSVSPTAYSPQSTDDLSYDAVSLAETGLNASTQADGELVQPKVIAEAPDATWYVRPAAGGQYGPAPTGIIWQWLVEGRVGVDSLVWRDDWPEWHPANQVFAEFFANSQNDSELSFASREVQGYPTSIPSGNSSIAEVSRSAVWQSTAELCAPVTTVPIGTIGTAPSAAPVLTKREARKRSRRVKYTVIIAILVMLLLGLGIGLLVILFKQGVTP